MAMLLVLPAFDPAWGQRRPTSPGAPDFDIRAEERLRSGVTLETFVANPTQEAELAAMRDAQPDLMVRWSVSSGAPKKLHAYGKPITGPLGDSAENAAWRFVRDSATLLRLDSEDLGNLSLTRSYRTQHNGVSHVFLQHQVDGIDIFGARLRMSFDVQNRLLDLSGELVPGAHRAARDRAPALEPQAALDAAALAAGVQAAPLSRSAGLTWFLRRPGELRLAWEVRVEDVRTPNVFRTLVDATSGEILWRQNTTYYNHIPAHGLVFPDEGPDPNIPTGTSTGLVPRQDIPFTGIGVFPHGDSHFDWWNGSGEADRNTTRSNNVRAKQDRDGDNDDSEGFFTTTGENFNPPLDLTMDPSASTNAAITNLFYFNNVLHDRFYRLGFDEAAGNFQSSNFGLGGSGGDPVEADAQDNRAPADPDDASLCNANMNTPDDGDSPRMQMYQCDGNTPERDGDFDNPVITHEFCHGLHSRLVPTQGFQRGNEGWGDYFGMSFSAQPGDNLDGWYEIGWWLFDNGIRRQPYTTDQSVFTRTYADIIDGARCALGYCSNDNTTTCSADADCGDGNDCLKQDCDFHEDCDAPPQPVDLGLCSPEVHDTGELWAETLWLMRANLVRKHGFATGGRTADLLVVDGMKFSDDFPDFLEGRDGILEADGATNGGVNQCLIWNAFAKMGMGFSALTVDEYDIHPVEAFDTPAACTPNIQVNAPSDFGDVCLGSFKTAQLTVSNNGTADLEVTSVARVSGSTDITVDPLPDTPVLVSPGAQLDFTVRCEPTTIGPKTATIRVTSNDPDTPQIDIVYTCNAPPADINVTGSGAFGNVCGGALAEKVVSVCNTGLCTLNVTAAFLSQPGLPHVADCTDFTIVANPFPDAVSHDFCMPLTVRFTPTSDGPKACDLVIQSDDPDEATVVLTVTASTPTAAIDVPPDLGFAPEVIQSVGSCTSELPFPISNTGACPLTITAITVNQNPVDFGLSGLPSFPIFLDPGDIVGDGDLRAVFRPHELDRDLTGQLTVSYLSDAVTGEVTQVTRNLCGEGVLTGARVLVRAAGVPLGNVKQIKLQRRVGNTNRPRVDTVGTYNNVPLSSVTPALPCLPFQYHQEFGTVSNPLMLAPGTYLVTATVVLNGHTDRQTVSFDVSTCDFNPTVIIDF